MTWTRRNRRAGELRWRPCPNNRRRSGSSKKGLKRIRRDNKRALKALKREGMKIIESPQEMIEEFEEVAEKMWQAGVGTAYTQDELDMVLKYRKKYRDKQAKKAEKASEQAKK